MNKFIPKYKLIDFLNTHKENCEAVDAKYIQIIVNTLTDVAPMSSSVQFKDLFQKICDQLNLHLSEDGVSPK